MNDPESSLDRYLDGLMGEAETEAFEEALAGDPNLAHQVQQQREMDAAIRRQFEPPEVNLSFLDDYLTEESANQTADFSTVLNPNADEPYKKKRKFLLLAVAASLAWAMVAVQWFYGGKRGDQAIAFQPQPLTDLYQQCLDGGFDPYWVCDNEDVFAATFQRRQGVPLILANLPSDRSMVGLSYLAGISRNSTSILARMSDVPVIVFVDQLKFDWKPEVGFFEEQGLRVFRSESDDLVFYEVSPFDEPKIAPFLKPRTQP